MYDEGGYSVWKAITPSYQGFLHLEDEETWIQSTNFEDGTMGLQHGQQTTAKVRGRVFGRHGYSWSKKRDVEIPEVDCNEMNKENRRQEG